MAHPFQAQARSGSRAKFKAMVGKSGKGQAHPDEPQDRKLIKQVMAERDMAVTGKKSGGRLDKYARGGKVKDVNINIAVGKPPEAYPLPPVLPPLAPPIPPPGLAGPPGGLPLPPPGPPGPPMMRKAGGRVNKQVGGALTREEAERPKSAEGAARAAEAMGKSGTIKPAHADWVASKIRNLGKGAAGFNRGGVKKARGGRFTGGAETGVGRQEKASRQKNRRG